jgi:hypothetical protein
MVTVSNCYGVGSLSSDEIVERCDWVDILWHIDSQVSLCKMHETKACGNRQLVCSVI